MRLLAAPPLLALVGLLLVGCGGPRVGPGGARETPEPAARAAAPVATTTPVAPTTPPAAPAPAPAPRAPVGSSPQPSSPAPLTRGNVPVPVPGTTPPVLDRLDVYAADRRGLLSPTVRRHPARVYVANAGGNTVAVIDQRSFRVIRQLTVGQRPRQVTPSWDLQTLWVVNEGSDSLTAINPRTSKVVRTVSVDAPHSLYFSPDGQRAIVLSQSRSRLDFRDPGSMRLERSLAVNCQGVAQMDYTADGSKALASCTSSGQLALIDLQRERVLRYVSLGAGSTPDDVRLAPNGKRFFVADSTRGGLWIVGAASLGTRFVPTGAGASGITISRNARKLFVSNRDAGTVSVLAANSGRSLTTWRIPGGANPGVGGVSPNGRVLWLPGSSGEVYALATRDGRLIHRLATGNGASGLSVWPQPGRYSIGHTGVMR